MLPLAVGLCVCGYLLGSVPIGFMAGRLFGVDLRKVGSKKTGATNTFRVLGWRGFALVLIGDLLKGALAVALARIVTGDPAIEALAGFAAVIGHNWSIYIKFAGGRGVATGLGALMVMSPLTVVVALVLALVIVGLTRYVSLASIAGSALLPIVMAAQVVSQGAPMAYLVYAAAAGALVIIQHRDNIHRLVSGTERKFGTRIEGA